MSDRVWIGTRKGLFEVTRQEGGEWGVGSVHFLGESVTYVLPSDGRHPMYAASNHGNLGPKLHSSVDAGRSWTECAVPAYPPGGGTKERAPALEQIWCLEVGDATLWCGTIPGGLFASEDGAHSWRLVQTLWDHPTRPEWCGAGYDQPGIHSIAVDPRWPDHLLVAISRGGLWATTNGGVSWELRTQGMWAGYVPPEKKHVGHLQDPHRLVRCARRPECLWVQHHNGAFRSIDEGRSWSEVQVPPSSFGFAVSVHPEDPDTAWFVPAANDDMRVPVDGRLTVARTRDGGASFELLGEGLPSRHAYDLVYRHGLDVDPTGERLAMGSTTGSLWISENGGDSWTRVGAHLPPIYCVRFE